MKNHTVTVAEIAIEYKIQLAAQVDAQKGKKELIANVIPGRSNVFQVFNHGHLVFESYAIADAVAAYNNAEL